ncbi:uncharacterized protein FSUBG_7945 [Fusarium subglutinans]|uniref:F-box domain-containing protein n=1 Tax=Gibberella subglutinans TaxID=42677 RepID=A0A8H5PSS7_GIBSU|nr:uncharacterized protein FSUBG_7945 [Fusarium subglutinans]KAF5601963.1 hypothetical protein FSUBG_7945 [Fusarium subglutinans]
MDQQRLITEFFQPNSPTKQDHAAQYGSKARIAPPRKSEAASHHNIESGTSQLLTLPAELRLEIYRHLLISKNYAELYHCNSKISRLVPIQPMMCHLKIHPKFLLTCRIINKEATPVLYSENVFRRRYVWPSRYVAEQVRRMSPLNKFNVTYISRLHLFRDYNHWFCDGELKIFNEVPHLKDLYIQIDLNNFPDGVDLSELPYRTLKAIPPKLRSFKMEILLNFSEEAHSDWLAKCGKDRKTENFSIHLDRKRALETRLEHEGLFTDRSLFWTFKTMRHEWGVLPCSISFAFDNKRKEYEYIDLEAWDHGGNAKFGRLKTSEENASSLVLRE